MNIRVARKWTRFTSVAVTATLATIGLATLCILFTPLPNWLSYPLYVQSSPAIADTIVVLGAGTARDGTLTDASLRRVWHGVHLYKEGLAPSLLFSTGRTKGQMSEARAMAGAAMIMGVPSQAILLEENSKRTFENAVEVKRVLESNSFKSVLLVTNPTHMARATAAFRKVGVKALPAATDYNEMGANGPLRRATLFINVTYEYLAWIFYWWRGWV